MLVLCLAALSCVATSSTHAQEWPTKPITIISPYSAGGVTDQLARIVGDGLSKLLGQAVVVEEKTGAGGAIAMAAVAKAKPDGYTLVMGGSAPSTVVPAWQRVSYDPVRDFEPVAYVAALPIVLVASTSVTAPSLSAFMEYAKAHADQLNCGNNGFGTGTYLACLMFARKLGVTIANIAYRGAPEVNQDLIAGRVQFYFGTLPTELPLIRAGRIRAYGIASDQRTSAAPEIPSFAELGVQGLNFDSWNALYAPAKTPQAVLVRLRLAVEKVLQLPEIRKRIEATGSVMRPISAEQLGSMTAEQFKAYRRLAAETGLRPK